MDRMFYDCILLNTLNISGFDTTNLTEIKSMFYSCNELKKAVYSKKFDRSKLDPDSEQKLPKAEQPKGCVVF